MAATEFSHILNYLAQLPKSLQGLREFMAKQMRRRHINAHDWKPTSISRNSVNEIAKAFINQSLSEPVKREVCKFVKEWCRKFLILTFEYVRYTRAKSLKCTHLYTQDFDLCVRILRLNKQPVAQPVETEDLLRQTVEAMIKEKFDEQESLNRFNKKRKPVSKATMSPNWKIIRNPSTRWIKHEQVYLKPHKQILTEEQLNFYQLITETCVGPSEKKRRRALLTLSTDSSLDELLPALTVFIADAVQVNVVQQNITMLLHLMRMARVLVANPNLCLPKCLHQLIPAVLTCLLTRQDSTSPAVEDHWALREYAGNLISEIVWHFNNSHNAILPRIIKIYNAALRKQPLTTIYGAVIGLGKLGNYVIRACLIPQIAYISTRIEKYLIDTNGSTCSSINKQTAKYIRHRILKVCTPILMKLHNPPDELKKYGRAYGSLGYSLCDAVSVSRIKVAAIDEAQKEEAAAKLLAAEKKKQEQIQISLKNSTQEVSVEEPVSGCDNVTLSISEAGVAATADKPLGQ